MSEDQEQGLRCRSIMKDAAGGYDDQLYQRQMTDQGGEEQILSDGQ